MELCDTSVVLGKIILQNRAEVIEIGVIVERIESSLENYRTGTKNGNSDRLGISPYGDSLGEIRREGESGWRERNSKHCDFVSKIGRIPLVPKDQSNVILLVSDSDTGSIR